MVGFDGKSPLEKRFGLPFPGLDLPFGCKVMYLPTPISKSPTVKLDPNRKEGIFLGYDMQPGFEFTGGYLVAPLASFVGKDFRRDAKPGDFRIKVETIREEPELCLPIAYPCKAEYDRANGSIEGLRGDYVRPKASDGSTLIPPVATGDSIVEDLLFIAEQPKEGSNALPAPDYESEMTDRNNQRV